MPKYLTVKSYHECHCRYIREIDERTVYRWIKKKKLKAKKDCNGHDWLIIIRKKDSIYPFLGQI